MGTICQAGELLTGRQKGNLFIVKECLHKGAGWEIYKVNELQTGLNFAMKISMDFWALLNEFKLIVLMNEKTQIRSLKMLPSVYLMDNCFIKEKICSYYIMDLKEGRQLSYFWGKLKPKDMSIIFNKLNRFLAIFKELGFEFHDLKPSDILYEKRQKKISILNFNKIVSVKSRFDLDRNLVYRGLLEGNKDSVPIQKNEEEIKNYGPIFNLIGLISMLLFFSSLLYYYL